MKAGVRKFYIESRLIPQMNWVLFKMTENKLE
jgi:hypothetical protein